MFFFYFLSDFGIFFTFLSAKVIYVSYNLTWFLGLFVWEKNKKKGKHFKKITKKKHRKKWNRNTVFIIFLIISLQKKKTTTNTLFFIWVFLLSFCKINICCVLLVVIIVLVVVVSLVSGFIRFLLLITHLVYEFLY